MWFLDMSWALYTGLDLHIDIYSRPTVNPQIGTSIIDVHVQIDLEARILQPFTMPLRGYAAGPYGRSRVHPVLMPGVLCLFFGVFMLLSGIMMSSVMGMFNGSGLVMLILGVALPLSGAAYLVIICKVKKDDLEAWSANVARMNNAVYPLSGYPQVVQVGVSNCFLLS